MTHGKILGSLGNIDKMAISILFYDENLLFHLTSLKLDFFISSRPKMTRKQEEASRTVLALLSEKIET